MPTKNFDTPFWDQKKPYDMMFDAFASWIGIYQKLDTDQDAILQLLNL